MGDSDKARYDHDDHSYIIEVVIKRGPRLEAAPKKAKKVRVTRQILSIYVTRMHDYTEAETFARMLAAGGAVFTKMAMSDPQMLDAAHDAYYNEERLKEIERWPFTPTPESQD